MPGTADRMMGTLVLTPLTPVHVGSGNVLLPMDYAIRNKRYEVKDVARFFQDNRSSVDFALDAVANGLPIGSEYVRYSLPWYGDAPGPGRQEPAQRGGGGAPRSHQDQPKTAFNSPFAALAARGQEAPPPEAPARAKTAPARAAAIVPELTVGDVREFIKDPFGLAFLPGSSIKGALRSAIAWTLAQHIDLERAVADMLRNDRVRKEWAGDPILKQLFGSGPTTDLLKAFHVADSAPLPVDGAFAMSQVTVMNDFRGQFKPKTGVPIHVEALMPSVGSIRVPIRVDLFRLANDRDLSSALNGIGVALLRDKVALENAFREFSKALLDYEYRFYERRNQAAASFVRSLAGSGVVVLPLGFGTGWHAKTLGRQLSDDAVRALRKRFTGQTRDGRLLKNMGNPDVPDLFPKTRKWARGPEGDRPMGWCKLEIVWT
jgi:CRISPR-associated protein Csm5